MPAIAEAGAGPGLGLSITRVFGGHGSPVALISRDKARRTRHQWLTRTDQITAEAQIAAMNALVGQALEGVAPEDVMTGADADQQPTDGTTPRQPKAPTGPSEAIIPSGS
jgi:hypothetical protein